MCTHLGIGTEVHVVCRRALRSASFAEMCRRSHGRQFVVKQKRREQNRKETTKSWGNFSGASHP
jgi:hypothetical protein